MALMVYRLLDSFSRKILGHRADERDVDALAVDIFEITFGIKWIPEDANFHSGSAMRSNVLLDLFADSHLTPTRTYQRV